MPPRKSDKLCHVGGTKRHELNKGLLCSCTLKAGTLLLEERPLFHSSLSFLTDPNTTERENAVRDAIEMDLSGSELGQFNKLSSRDDRFWTSTFEDTPFTGIICGSGIPLSIRQGHPGFGEIGVFVLLSRLNHDCQPNCSLVWDEKTETAKLYLLRDAKPGDELTISYVPDCALDHEYLFDTFNFHCVCIWCLRSEAFKNKSVERRQKVEDLRLKVHEAVVSKNVIAALENGYKVIKLMRKLSINDFRFGSTLRRLFDVLVQAGDPKRAKFFAIHAYLAYELCEGPDSLSISKLINKVDRNWRMQKEDEFVDMVRQVKEKNMAYLGFEEDESKGEVFTQKVLEEFFEKESWKGQADNEIVLSDDDGKGSEGGMSPEGMIERLYISEDAVSRFQKATPRFGNENHHAKSKKTTPKKSMKTIAPTKKVTSCPARRVPASNQSTEELESVFGQDLDLDKSDDDELLSRSYVLDNSEEDDDEDDYPSMQTPSKPRGGPRAILVPRSMVKSKKIGQAGADILGPSPSEDVIDADEEWKRHREVNQRHLRTLAESQMRAGVRTGVHNDKRRRLADGPVHSSTVIDLTGDDDDDVQPLIPSARGHFGEFHQLRYSERMGPPQQPYGARMQSYQPYGGNMDATPQREYGQSMHAPQFPYAYGENPQAQLSPGLSRQFISPMAPVGSSFKQLGGEQNSGARQQFKSNQGQRAGKKDHQVGNSRGQPDESSHEESEPGH